MTDNFDLIKSLLKFENEDDFYYIQILARKKENENSKSVKQVKDYYVSNMEYFESHEQQIKDLCEFFNARAYIRLSRRSWTKVAFEMNKKLAEVLQNGQFEFSRKVFNKAAGRGRSISEPTRIWHVDMDKEDFESEQDFNFAVSQVKSFIDELHTEIQKDYKRIIDVPTPNGLHIVTEPFNVAKFLQDGLIKKFGLTGDDIQKNNPTILFTSFKTNKLL